MRTRYLLATLACSATLNLLTGCSRYSAVSEYQQTQEQRKSFLETVAATGGKIEMKSYKVANVSGSAWNMNLANATIPDELITLMVGTGYLGEANLSKSSITDAQLLKMDELKLLQLTMNLDLSNTAISDESFSKLKHMRAASKINLKGTKVTKAGVEAFRKAYLANPETIVIFKKPVIEL
ncbi:MAG TPA: hypothetical protein VM452_17975 [Caulifigura sp.]|jgi:hypothetical protein|nr:hypothetical protein [Caulifigura sp.]